jgi:hypothetical protein
MGAVAAHGITWRHDFDEAVKDAARRNMHVLVDFTAAPM